MADEQAPGILALPELNGKIESGEIDTVLAVVPDLFGRLLGRHIPGIHFLEETTKQGFWLPGALFVPQLGTGSRPGAAVTSGGDIRCRPLLETLRLAPWLDRTALVFCQSLEATTGQPLAVAPRSLLQTQLDRLAEAGYRAQAGASLDFYIFNEAPGSLRARAYQGPLPAEAFGGPADSLPAGRLEPLLANARRYLLRGGVAVAHSQGTAVPGQYSLGLAPAGVMALADGQALAKQCLKLLAPQYGQAVSFMAQVTAEMAGSVAALRLSLWSPAGRRNRFGGEEVLGPGRASDECRWFLGGWLRHLPALMPFFAPTVNSYKRYVLGDGWRVAWSGRGYPAGVRVVEGPGRGAELESWLAGADVNLYLAYAAWIAAGLDGLAHKTEPPDLLAEPVLLPTSLAMAVDALAGSDFARQAFGDAVVDFYVAVFRQEQAAYELAVTDWERGRYFEQI
ncbi:MAG: glutamine synthetase [Pseudomonadales bacterium]|nr:glutamine synthetase [Pseudomonadales bacterium]